MIHQKKEQMKIKENLVKAMDQYNIDSKKKKQVLNAFDYIFSNKTKKHFERNDEEEKKFQDCTSIVNDMECFLHEKSLNKLDKEIENHGKNRI